jgi:hypothetical protein
VSDEPVVWLDELDIPCGFDAGLPENGSTITGIGLVKERHQRDQPLA